MQIIFLLPLVSTLFPSKVMLFFRFTRFLLMEFNFTHLEDYTIVEYSDLEENENLALKLLGFRYRSGLINILENLAMILFLIILQIIFFPIYAKFKRMYKRKDNSSKAKFGTWISSGFYIRYLMLSYVLYLVAAISDINNIDLNDYLWYFCTSVLIFSL